MSKEKTWFERYRICLKEYLSIKDIMYLRNVGQPTAIKLREEALTYCMKNDIPLQANKPPTEVILRLTGKDEMFYYKKMKLELEAVQMHKATYGS